MRIVDSCVLWESDAAYLCAYESARTHIVIITQWWFNPHHQSQAECVVQDSNTFASRRRIAVRKRNNYTPRSTVSRPPVVALGYSGFSAAGRFFFWFYLVLIYQTEIIIGRFIYINEAISNCWQRSLFKCIYLTGLTMNGKYFLYSFLRLVSVFKSIAGNYHSKGIFHWWNFYNK